MSSGELKKLLGQMTAATALTHIWTMVDNAPVQKSISHLFRSLTSLFTPLRLQLQELSSANVFTFQSI